MSASNYREWYLQLVDQTKQKPIDDDTGSFQVYQPASPVRQVIYNAAGTQLTQEVVGSAFISRTMTNGILKFYTAVSASSVDISILTAGGRSYFLKAMASSQHRVDVETDRRDYTLVAAFNDRASCTTVRPLGFKLKKGMRITDVYIKVSAAFAGGITTSNRYSAGRSGSPKSFVNNRTLTALGFAQLHPHVSSTGAVLLPRYGTDLLDFFAGSSTGGCDMYVRKNYIAATATASNNLVVKRLTAATLTHSFTNTGVSGAGKAYLFYVYSLAPTEA